MGDRARVPQIRRSTRFVEVLKESSHQSVQMLSSISPSWLSQTRNSLGGTHNWAFPCQVGGCYFSRPRWLPTITLASSIPEGGYPSPRPSFGRKSLQTLASLSEGQSRGCEERVPPWGTSATWANITSDNAEFKYPQCVWERPREFWQTGRDAHIAVGKRVLGGLMEVFGGFVQPVFLPRQKRLQIHGCGLQNCFS